MTRLDQARIDRSWPSTTRGTSPPDHPELTGRPGARGRVPAVHVTGESRVYYGLNGDISSTDLVGWQVVSSGTRPCPSAARAGMSYGAASQTLAPIVLLGRGTRSTGATRHVRRTRIVPTSRSDPTCLSCSAGLARASSRSCQAPETTQWGHCPPLPAERKVGRSGGSRHVPNTKGRILEKASRRTAGRHSGATATADAR